MTTTFLSSRDTLAATLRAIEKAAPFDYDAVGWKQRNDHIADALLASGVVVAPDVYLAELVDDIEWRLGFAETMSKGFPTEHALAALIGEVRAALAAALATPATEETGT